MSQSRSAPLGVLLALGACHPGGAYGPLPDPVVTVLDPGEGPENELPLEPLRLGSWAASQTQLHRLIGPIDAGRHALVAVEATESASLLRARRGDVVIHRLGAPLDPERPSGLWVPERVRVDMRWRSELEDGAWYGLGVTAREERMTPLGPVTAWALTELGDDEMPNPYANTYWYAEGIGFAESAFSPEFGDSRDALRAWVVPERDQPSEGLPLRPEALAAFTDAFGQPVGACGGPDCESTVGAWTARIDGEPALVHHAAWLSEDGVQQWSTFCYPLSAAGDAVGRMEACRVGLLDLMETLDRRPFPANMPLQHLRQLRGLPAWMAHAWFEAGEPRALHDDARADSGKRALRLYRGAAVGDLGACTTDPSLCAVVTDAALVRGLTDGWSLTSATAGYDSAGPMARATFGRWEVAPGEPVVFGVLAQDGSVFETRLVGEQLEGWRLVGRLPGQISVADDPAGPSLIGLTPDLRLHRARVDGDRVVVEALGDLPPVTFNGDQISATLDPVDPSRVFLSVRHSAVNPAFSAPIQVARLSRPPLEVSAPATFGLGFGDWLGAVTVCWPAAEEVVQTGSWTLRGEPVDPVIGGPEGRCALIRDEGAVAPEWVGAERAMSLDLPGIGPVRVGYTLGTRAWDFGARPQGMMAPTRDGGAVDVAGLRLDADGFPVERRPTGISQVSLHRAWRDLSGDGLYAVPYNLAPLGPMLAVGSSARLPEELGWTWIGGVVDGGAVLAMGETWVRYGAGEPETVPEAQRLAVRDVLRGTPGWQNSFESSVVALADGDLCVARTPTVACVSPAGEVRRIEQPYVSVGAVERHSFWPLPGGDLLVLGTSGTIHRLEPATMALEPYLEGYLHGLATGHDGRVWATRTTPNSGPAHYLELTDAGPVEVFPVDAQNFQAIPHGRGWLVSESDGWRLRWR